MSLVPKLDEVQQLLLRLNVQVECIVESWLKQHIIDSLVNIDRYNIEHGGACIYIQDHIKFETPESLQCCNDHEIIRLKLNPPIVRKSTEGATKKSTRSSRSRFQLVSGKFIPAEPEKTKELTISFQFRPPPQHFDPVTVDGTQIQTRSSSKLLSLIINNTLAWNDHIDNLIKKAARKIYLLVQLNRRSSRRSCR